MIDISGFLFLLFITVFAGGSFFIGWDIGKRAVSFWDFFTLAGEPRYIAMVSGTALVATIPLLLLSLLP